MEKKYVDKVMDLLRAVPDISELTMNPGIFDHSREYDCDTCPASRDYAGDLYDPDVCYDCWKTSITNS